MQIDLTLEGELVKNANKINQDRVIEENLKRVFDETLEEGIPDRFKSLLSQLKQQDAEQGSSK
ncbi:NepR family anti-sigma factor [uncultured Sulfitobacter sp.]|uniref:NepR family anti-sigma factor n=1 Tax=uncultured Sulfitobacter sp. TaxID=191468 RepID=UPI00345D6074